VIGVVQPILKPVSRRVLFPAQRSKPDLIRRTGSGDSTFRSRRSSYPRLRRIPRRHTETTSLWSRRRCRDNRLLPSSGNPAHPTSTVGECDAAPQKLEVLYLAFSHTSRGSAKTSNGIFGNVSSKAQFTLKSKLFFTD
jgi:hypothetical protein